MWKHWTYKIDFEKFDQRLNKTCALQDKWKVELLKELKYGMRYYTDREVGEMGVRQAKNLFIRKVPIYDFIID